MLRRRNGGTIDKNEAAIALIIFLAILITAFVFICLK